MTGPRRATICVTTFQRPLGLARVLHALARLETVPGWEFDIVVVDNDVAESGRAVAEASDVAVRYVCEARRGLPVVRNRAVRAAGATPWIAFMDDDEWPETTWWRRLVEEQMRSDADVVIGPSQPVFEREPEQWIRDGAFFERERFPTGTEIPFWRARTSGVLIRRASFEYLGDRPFDERNPLHGGEDRVFFEKLEAHGARIVWVDDAIVYEYVPTTRANARWLLRRAFRIGNTRSVKLVLEDATFLRRVRRALRGCVDMMLGAGRLVIARNKAERVSAASQSAVGLGLIAGAFGVRYDEYVVTHGS